MSINFLLIDSIEAVVANADTAGRDETYITVNGSRIFGPKSMGSGSSAVVNRGLGVQGTARVQLFDEDGFLNGGDDSMGGFTITQPTNNSLASRQVSGSGSTYNVFYHAF
jgi:hypothetical protein